MPEPQSIEIKKKIFLLGNDAVGKTSLIRRFVKNEFGDAYLSTIGTKVSKKAISIPSDPEEPSSPMINVTLMIWDVMGQRTFHTVVSKYFDGAEGALLVCDLTRPNTLASVKHWKKLLFDRAGKVPILILANKFDLKDRIRIGPESLEQLAEDLETVFFVTSAKTGENVNEVFMKLAGKMAEISK